MLTAEDLALRRTGLSATDMTVIAGVSPYGRTVHDIYLDKMGLSEPVEQTPAMAFGLRVEKLALAILGEDRGLAITPGGTERHPETPWIVASPDGNVLHPQDGHRIGVAEAKAVGIRMAYRWGESGDPNAVPDEVRVQVQWQMVTTCTRMAHIVAIIGTDVRFYAVEHDEELATALIALGHRFWHEQVLAQRAPAIDGSEASARMVRGLFRKASAGVVPAPPESHGMVAEYLAAKAAADDAEKRKTAAQANLCALIGESEGIESADWIATWKERAGSTDWKSLAEKLGADKKLAEQYRREGTRVLTVKSKNKRAA